MNKYKKLLGNSFIFAIGNFGSKLMQFIMVPLYSYTLTTSEFGRVDILTTIVNLIAPIIGLDIFDAVFRFALDKGDNKKETFSTGLFFIIIVSIVTLFCGFALRFLSFTKNYPVGAASILLVFTMLFSLISNYTRAIGKIVQFAVAGVINTFVMGILNIILLIVFKQGMQGYMQSMIWGLVIATVYLFIYCDLYTDINIKFFRLKKFRDLSKYSLPLIPNVLAWWLNSSSDRIFILMFLGASTNGIYAMASKIPNMLSTIINIFFQSWQISAVEEYNSEDSKKFISNVFDAFVSFLFILAIGLLTFLKPIFRVLVSHSYYIGWKIVPFLLLALIYTSIAGFLGTIYTATKKTLPIMITTIYGAIINIVISVILIKTYGVNGAAIANAISFLVVSILRFKDVNKAGRIGLNFYKLICLHIVFFFIATLDYFTSDLVVAFFGVICVILLLAFNKYTKLYLKIITSKIRE